MVLAASGSPTAGSAQPRPVTILSPHPDDAVLSLWHLLVSAHEVSVLNVFGGEPSGSGGRRWWDRLTGATDSAQRMRERHAEDREALAMAGREPDNLDFLEGQYRTEEQPVEPVAAAIAQRVAAPSRLYAPAALDGHRGHRLVRAAALALAGEGYEVTLYADAPHCVVYGWPAWVTGAAPQPYLDPDAYWEEQLLGTGIEERRRTADVRALAPDELRGKRDAVAAYRTQVPALEAQFGSLSEGDALTYEVLWPLPA